MCKSFPRHLSTLVMLFVLGACAITEEIVDVNYTGTTEAVSIGVDGKQFSLFVEDVRGEYFGRIGAKVNGFGTEMADIKSTVPVRDVLYKAIENELASRGIVLDDGSAPKIDIAITALHNNFQVGVFSGAARGITAFTVKVSDATGAVVYNTAVSEVFVVEDVMLFTGDNAALAIEGALNNSMQSLFGDDQFIAALVGA